jgi:hypothetical protein
MKFTGSAGLRHAAIVLFAALGAASLSQTASAQNAALQGTWNLVPEKSTTTKPPVRFKSGKLTVTDGGQVMDLDALDAGGKPVKANISAVADGKPHPVTGFGNFDAGTWTQNNPNNSSFKFMKGKDIAALGTRVLSTDGSTITITEQDYDNKGKFLASSTLVFVNPDVKVATVVPQQQQQVTAPPPPRPALNPDETAASEVLAKGNDDEAIRLFTAIISGKPTDMFYYDHVSRGIAYARKGQNDQALADFNEALKLKPDNVDARFRRGGTLAQMKNYKDAVTDMDAVIMADEKNAAAYRVRGMSHNFLGQANEGAADNDKACELDKSFCMN